MIVSSVSTTESPISPTPANTPTQVGGQPMPTVSELSLPEQDVDGSVISANSAGALAISVLATPSLQAQLAAIQLQGTRNQETARLNAIVAYYQTPDIRPYNGQKTALYGMPVLNIPAELLPSPSTDKQDNQDVRIQAMQVQAVSAYQHTALL